MHRDIEELKHQICNCLTESQDAICKIADDLLHLPELGFREVKTAEYIERAFRKIGLEDIQTGLAITGVRGTLRGKTGRHKVAVIAELDAIICTDHPYADSVTGAAHACGHFMQLVVMLSIAAALKKLSDIASESIFYGDVVFMAVPCEEGVDSNFADELMAQDKNRFLSGKQEFIRLGVMDDIDAVLMVHTAPTGDRPEISIPCGSNTFLTKHINIIGKAAHAGGEAHLGINAINCATLVIAAINALRETFQDEHHIRVNTILKNAGSANNTIPEKTDLEICIRARTLEALTSVNQKIDRAVNGCCYAMNAQYHIRNTPGYMSFHSAGEAMIDYVKGNAISLSSAEFVSVLEYANIMTDSGDLSNVIPTIQVSVGGGFDGMHHQKDFLPMRSEWAYLIPAKLLATSIADLLCDEDKGIQRVKSSYDFPYTKESFLQYWDINHF